MNINRIWIWRNLLARQHYYRLLIRKLTSSYYLCCGHNVVFLAKVLVFNTTSFVLLASHELAANFWNLTKLEKILANEMFVATNFHGATSFSFIVFVSLFVSSLYCFARVHFSMWVVVGVSKLSPWLIDLSAVENFHLCSLLRYCAFRLVNFWG